MKDLFDQWRSDDSYGQTAEEGFQQQLEQQEWEKSLTNQEDIK